MGLVEDGHLAEPHFTDFMCGNVVRMLTGMHPSFLEATAVADAVRPYLRIAV
jgi:hypothetical protein